MTTAVVERLNDLADVARRLAELVEADRKAKLPGLLVARVAVEAGATARRASGRRPGRADAG